jgi:hypothetical protein
MAIKVREKMPKTMFLINTVLALPITFAVSEQCPEQTVKICCAPTECHFGKPLPINKIKHLNDQCAAAETEYRICKSQIGKTTYYSTMRTIVTQ